VATPAREYAEVFVNMVGASAISKSVESIFLLRVSTFNKEHVQCKQTHANATRSHN